ncbi:hypothetical protein HMPREF3038_01610 [Akkermansia sp. KLE1797]|nr:hypothetical protein HMPREF3038_01610 [Akkermansia sp. KLE1797]KXU54100.1 hypothetical protein HMPREF3039_01765 [Akkermansia sp. KLE1798]KZA05586.1 hypothetical protein HMPREF1326_00761 [Akkermansia sp. KLE1605]
MPFVFQHIIIKMRWKQVSPAPYAGGSFHQCLIALLVIRRDKGFGVIFDDIGRLVEGIGCMIYGII